MRRRKPQDLNWLDLTYMCALWEVARKLLHGVDTNVDSFVSNFCHHIRVLHQRVIGHLKKSLPVLGHLHFVSKLLFFSSFFPFAESQFCFLFSLSLSLLFACLQKKLFRFERFMLSSCPNTIWFVSRRSFFHTQWSPWCILVACCGCCRRGRGRGRGEQNTQTHTHTNTQTYWVVVNKDKDNEQKSESKEVWDTLSPGNGMPSAATWKFHASEYLSKHKPVGLEAFFVSLPKKGGGFFCFFVLFLTFNSKKEERKWKESTGQGREGLQSDRNFGQKSIRFCSNLKFWEFPPRKN